MTEDPVERCSLIVVGRDRFSTTESCIETLIANTHEPHEIIVVLGGAPVSLRTHLESRYAKRVRFIFRSHFLNGSEARNIGLGEATTRLSVCLENDVHVRPRWLAALIRCQKETGAGAVIPLMLADTHVILAAGSSLYITCIGGKDHGSRTRIHHGQAFYESANLQRTPIDYGEARCQLIETQSALRLGVFDERLVGLEDVDSGLAWRKEGSTVWFEPTSVVVCDTLRRLDDPDDVRFFAWRWDVRRAMAACQMFREKWGIDITNAGELKNSLIEINDKIGILPRVWPSRPALLMDRLLGYLEDLPTRARDVRWRFAAHRLGFDDWRELETGRYGKPVSLATRFRRTTGRRWLKRATPWRSRQVKETVRIEVQDGVCIKISRKDRHNGKGPAAGVLAAGEEVLRFDCFGPNRGHYHVYPKRQYPGAPGPIYFTEDSIEAQIDLSVREILENTQRYLRSGPTDSIRNIQIDPDRLAHACSEMRIRMRAQAGLQTNESRPNPEGPVGGGVSSGRSMEAKLLYPTFGCLVEVGPITADDKDGADLLALDINWVRSLFKAHGLILFRGFATSMHVFRAFSEQLCEKFRSHSNVTQRIPVSEDGTVVTTNLGLGKVLLHGEMYYLSEERRPNVLWFYCSRPPVKGSGGETTFVDATLLLERLSPATTRCFEHKRIVYPKDGKPGADGNGSTKSTVTNAISWTRHGERAFINSILNRYQHVGGRSRHPSMVHFEDGSPIPDEIIAELQAASERLEESLEWQAGDVVMVDNSWIMHGRRAFSGPREVVTRMANLRTP